MYKVMTISKYDLIALFNWDNVNDQMTNMIGQRSHNVVLRQRKINIKTASTCSESGPESGPGQCPYLRYLTPVPQKAAFHSH